MIAPGSRLPYPGLRAFTREESDLFFGRDNCVDHMVESLAATRFLAVLGPSGSGKSSLVRTGLLDALDLGFHPWAGSRWQLADLHPGGQPLRNLASALLASKGPSSEEMDLALMTAFLSNGPRSAVEWALGGNLPTGTNLLILVDQFEELFRYSEYAQAEEAEAFVALLLESAVTDRVPIHVVITMRSEYLGACSVVPGLAQKMNRGLYLAPRMSREECREAIRGPASVMGFQVEPALVNRLLNDLATFAPWEADENASQLERLSRRADQLPLMQHVLNRLWGGAANEVGVPEVMLSLSDYEQIGGLSGALDAHGAAVIASLGCPEHERSVERVFRTLITGPTPLRAVRRPCPLGELVEIAGANRDEIVAIVEAFRAPDCNFLRTSEHSLAEDSVIVDISHESLIRQWSPLRQWLEQEALDGENWRRLLDAQKRHHRGEGGLLSGLDLQSALVWWEAGDFRPAWASRHGGCFEPVESFLENSKRAEAAKVDSELRHEIRERKRLRFGVAALAGALAIVTALAVFAWNKSRDAEASASQTLAVLDEVSSTLYSDRYTNLIGIAPLQSDLFTALLPYQSEMDRRYSAKVDPASIVMNEYRLGVALEYIGEARQALDRFARAYKRGKQALIEAGSSQGADRALEANLIEAGYRYAWFLFDIGEDEQGDEVLTYLKTIAKRRDRRDLSTELLFQYARLENLKSRHSSDHSMPEEAALEESRALELVLRATARPDATLEALKLRFTLEDSKLWSLQGDARQDLLRSSCELADSMLKRSPMDRGAIKAYVECLRSKALIAGENDDLIMKEEHLRAAEELLLSALLLVPDEQLLLLSMARLQIDLGKLVSQQGDEQSRRDYNLTSRDYFVRALAGRTLFQSNPAQVKELYGQFKLIDFPKTADGEAFSAEEFAFYQSISAALAPTLTAFPKSRSFSFVAADSEARLGSLLFKDATRHQEAESHLSNAIRLFERSGVMGDLSEFSEDFAAVCGAFSKGAELYSASERYDDMLSLTEKMTELCEPVLERYPWDFYLRQQFVRSARQAGDSLFKIGRYTEAIPHLEYASRWGDSKSSKLLARSYEEGLGVAEDEDKVRHLQLRAAGQSTKRFSLPVDFGNGWIFFPFHVYTIEWAAEDRPEGIDDQITWLKEARGGTVAPEIGDAFRQLHRIADSNGVPFGDLCVYALGFAIPEGKDIGGKRFDAAGAILLMRTGSYEKIRDLLRQKPDLRAEVINLGSELLGNGVTPDMRMLKKLQDIVARYMRRNEGGG